MRVDDSGDDAVGLGGIAGPVHLTAGLEAVALELLKIVIQVAQRVLFDGTAGFAEFFPIRRLVHHAAPLAADYVGGVAHVAAQLRVLQQLLRGNGKLGSVGGVADHTGHAPAPSRPGFRLDAWCARRCAGDGARRRCASSTSCHRRRRLRRRSEHTLHLAREHGGGHLGNSSRRRCRRSRSIDRHRAARRSSGRHVLQQAHRLSPTCSVRSEWHDVWNVHVCG